jgi:hypothetical protein
MWIAQEGEGGTRLWLTVVNCVGCEVLFRLC